MFLVYLYQLLSIFMLFFTSNNFIQFFLGWEGLYFYLLINFWFSRIQEVKSVLKALIVNIVGDISLMASF